MTDLDWAAIERRRVRRYKIGLVITAAGAVTGGLALALWDDNDRLATALLVAGGLLFLTGLAMVWCVRPGEAARQLQKRGSYRDQVQNEHVSQIMIMPTATLGLTVLGMTKAAEYVEGGGEWRDGALAAVVALNLMMLPVLVMGWDGGSRKVKKFLDDELTRTYRTQAMVTAFWVLMPSVTAVYLVGVWKPTWAIVALPGVLWLAAATASLRFALLHRAADRDE